MTAYGRIFWGITEKVRSVFGGGYYDETVYAPGYFDTDERLNNAVSWLRGHIESRLSPQSVFNLGAMIEQSSLTNRWLFLPRASFHYHLDDQHTLRMAYSTGSRQPTLYENNGRNVGLSLELPLKVYGVIASGGLDSEINRSLEIGYHWGKDRTHVDARWFRDRYSNYIGTFYRPVLGIDTLIPGVVLDFANETPFHVQGMELQWDWASTSGTRVFTHYAQGFQGEVARRR